MLNELARGIGKVFAALQTAANERERLRQIEQAAAADEYRKIAEFTAQVVAGLKAQGFNVEHIPGTNHYRFVIPPFPGLGVYPTPPAATPAEKAMKARNVLKRFVPLEVGKPIDDRQLFREALKATHPDGQGAFRGGNFFNEVVAAGQELGFQVGGKKQA